MKLTPGATYTLRNVVTLEEAYFHVTEVNGYKGQLIVYGETKRHAIYVPRTHYGIIEIGGRPAMFVILPDEQVQNIANLVRALKGQPLALREGQDLLFVVNMGVIPTFWDGNRYAAKDEYIEAGRKIIDLYWEWQEGGSLPLWFRMVRNVRQN